MLIDVIFESQVYTASGSVCSNSVGSRGSYFPGNYPCGNAPIGNRGFDGVGDECCRPIGRLGSSGIPGTQTGLGTIGTIPSPITLG